MLTGLEAGRSVSGNFLLPGDGKIRLENFLFPGEALTGLEAGRSVSGIRLGDFLLQGDGKIRLGPWLKSLRERRSPGWRLEDPSRRPFSAQGRKKNSQGHSPAKMIRARVESSLRSVSFRAAEPLPIELWILTSQALRLLCQRASPADRLSGG